MKGTSFQEQENARISALRKCQREKMNIDQLKEHRKKVAERVRLFQLCKKLRQQEITPCQIRQRVQDASIIGKSNLKIR